MKIASNIADLLFEHECVVIPGLGGFITKNHPASIHQVKHQFKPPHKEVVFNQHLRANDGMLLNYIAQKEALTYADAKRKMDRFVLRCVEEMEKGRRINFRNIGSIYFDNHKQIVFDVDATQNYLADSFGLTGFVSPMIKREDFKQKLEQSIRQQREEKQRKLHTKETPKTRTKTEAVFKASRRPNRYKKQVVFIAMLLFFMLVGWSYMNINTVSRYYAAYSGWIPFFYASPNEFVASHADKIAIDRYIPVKENKAVDELRQSLISSEATLIPAVVPQKTVKADEDILMEDDGHMEMESDKDIFEDESLESKTVAVEDYIAEDRATEEEAVISAIESTPVATQQTGFFIIAGAFREKDNAERLISQLRNKGFEANYAGQTNTGLWRVAFEAHQQRSTALRRLTVIQNEENPGAWIFSF